MIDEASLQLKLAEALDYGTEVDYQTFYRDLKALKVTVQTSKFQADLEKLHKSLQEFKGRPFHPTK